MQNYVNEGKTIEYTPSAPVKGGDIVPLGNVIAIAQYDLAAGETGACAAIGVFDLPKGSGAIAQGVKVYLSAGKVVAAEQAQVVGTCWRAAKAGDATVRVKINV